MKKEKIVLISACLLGEKCRYNGISLPPLNKDIINQFSHYRIVSVCPERTGGLPVPRDPAEIEPGKEAAEVLKGQARIVTSESKDLSSFFLRGIKKCLSEIDLDNVDLAILKDKSPSCGSSQVYDGTFSGSLKKGRGVFCEFLKRKKIKVISSESVSNNI